MKTLRSSANQRIDFDLLESDPDLEAHIPGLEDAVAVITGATGNLGRAIAGQFHAAGARTVLIDRDGSVTADKWQLRLAGYDLSSPASADEIVTDSLKHFGQADILVNTVGGFRGGKSVLQEDVETWDFLLNLNLRTALLMSRAFAGHMLTRGRGRIINVISRHALAGAANYAAYSASKAALLRMTESLAQELKGSGVTANCVIPGTMDTPQNREGLTEAEAAKLVPPGDVASVVVFLASELARSVTGAAIPVYGNT